MLEIVFAGLGLWMLISGYYPYGLLAGGKNVSAREVTKKEARLFGLLLLSFIPASLIIDILLMVLLGESGQTYLWYVEIACLLIVGFIATRLAKKYREPRLTISNPGRSVPPPLPMRHSGALPPPLPVTDIAAPVVRYLPHPNEEKLNRARMGLIVTACLTGAIAFPLAMVAFGQFTTPSFSAGGFWQTYSIYIIGGVVVALGVFGIVFFARRMKQ